VISLTGCSTDTDDALTDGEPDAAVFDVGVLGATVDAG
jgi:hypothetical protein